MFKSQIGYICSSAYEVQVATGTLCSDNPARAHNLTTTLVWTNAMLFPDLRKQTENFII
jgi:hypothetical protein